MDVVEALPTAEWPLGFPHQIRRVELLHEALHRQQIQIQVEHAEDVDRALAVREERLHVLRDVSTGGELADLDERARHER